MNSPACSRPARACSRTPSSRSKTLAGPVTRPARTEYLDHRAVRSEGSADYHGAARDTDQPPGWRCLFDWLRTRHLEGCHQHSACHGQRVQRSEVDLRTLPHEPLHSIDCSQVHHEMLTEGARVDGLCRPAADEVDGIAGEADHGLPCKREQV